jgi:hypothetical protein
VNPDRKDPLMRTRKMAAFAAASLALGSFAVACGDDDANDSDLENDVEDVGNEVEDEVEDGVEELDEEIDDTVDG